MKVDTFSAKAAHCIDQQSDVTVAAKRGQLIEIVQTPRCRLVVYHGHTGNVCMGIKQLTYRSQI
ncbi:hypothetical protein UM91_02090 [Pseudomonas oryzihabitans]|nr:hypothetical protein UM91_02090 [Pseudomonas oryzihabitans]